MLKPFFLFVLSVHEALANYFTALPARQKGWGIGIAQISDIILELNPESIPTSTKSKTHEVVIYMLPKSFPQMESS